MSIRLEKIAKRYGAVTAVEELTLETRPGEMLVLLGPSGCGKTTTLRLVAGLESASAGEIYVGERRVTQLPPQQRDVAMVFQNYALYPHMTVAENIAYPLRVRRKSKEDIAREVRRAAEKLKIAALLERRPRQLSGGERQRVALARALVRQPAAFLMDEPLSNLDANLRLEMRGELKRLQQELGTTTLYVTHDHTEAMTLGHRIALLRDGRLLQLGVPLELYRRPANRFVAEFLGSPPMNFLAGALEGQAFRCALGLIPLAPAQARAAAGKQKITLGFRPQDAEPARPPAPGHLEGEVYVVEETGSHAAVMLRNAGQAVTVLAAPGLRVAMGEALRVRVPAAAVHLFDDATGATLISGTGETECPSA